jgi:hypothetical protein
VRIIFEMQNAQAPALMLPRKGFGNHKSESKVR